MEKKGPDLQQNIKNLSAVAWSRIAFSSKNKYGVQQFLCHFLVSPL